MTASEFPMITSALSPRKLEQFSQAVLNLRVGLDAGVMPNPRFLEAKSTLSRSIEYGWSAAVQKPFSWNRDYMSEASDQEAKALRAFTGDPQTNTIKRMKRQAKAVGDTDAGRATRALLEEAGVVLQMVVEGKEIAVKKTAAPKPESALEKYQSPFASKGAMADVLKELEAITEDARKSLAAALRSNHVRTVDQFLKAQTEHYELPETDRPRRFDPFTYAKTRGHGTADPQLMQSISLIVIGQMSDGNHKFLERENAQDIYSTDAEKTADLICRSFLEKNLGKLASIIEGKDNYSGLKVLGRSVDPSQMEGRLRISFDDGSSFEARTQAVMSFSQFGTPFMRYPLTFHDVEMADGSSMKRPSEKKMNEDFAQITAEEQAAPAP